MLVLHIMNDKKCKQIIEEIKDPHNLNESSKEHIKGCKKCAATLSVMLTIKAGPTPTSSLVPSSSFVSGVLAGIGAKTAASATAASVATATTTAGTTISTKAIIGGIITVALATMLGFGIMLKTDGTLSTSNKKTKSEMTKSSIIETEFQKLTESKDKDVPVFRFDAPKAPP